MMINHTSTQSLQLNKIHNMDCRVGLKLIADNSIDTCITSPPYYGLRDYDIPGQIGLEDSLNDYISELVLVFREINRVLKPTGTLWLNLGDAYVGTGGDRKKSDKNDPYNCKSNNSPDEGRHNKNKNLKHAGLKPKDLIGLPWRVALALQDDGWYLRSDIIWNKTRCMPEAVKDRPTRSHEYLFLLSKNQNYYYDFESIMEPCTTGDPSPPRGSKGVLGNPHTGRRNTQFNKDEKVSMKNKRDVWHVPTGNFKGDHFATFPPGLIEPCVLAGCPPSGIVIDPFMGSGTTAYVAAQLQRNFTGFELNPDYIRLAEELRLKAIQLKF